MVFAGHAVQHDDATARRTVVAAAEGKLGLDLDCDIIGLDGIAPVSTVNNETPGPNGFQPYEGPLDPVHLIDPAKNCFSRGGLPRYNGDKRANLRLVRRGAEIGLNNPRTLAFPAACARHLFKGRGGGRSRVKSLDDDVGDAPRRYLMAAKAHHMCSTIWRQTFKRGSGQLLALCP